MPRNYYYIVNKTLGGVLSVAGNPEPGAALVLKSKITPANNTQLWYMDSMSNSQIQNVGSNLVLEKQRVGPSKDEFWVNLAVPRSDSRQMWSYRINSGLIENASDGKLDIWGTNAVMCSPSISVGETSEELPTPEPTAAADVASADKYFWQLQIAGQSPEEPDESPRPERVQRPRRTGRS
jgi:hypothetical protein